MFEETDPPDAFAGADAATGYGAFLRGLLHNPRGVSAPTPSSAALSRIIADQVDPDVPGLVVELGPGTGVVTEALLARGIAPRRIVAIEQHEGFFALVRARFPGIQALCGDAFRFETLISADAPIAAVVCGVPLMNFPLGVRQSLLQRALARQGADGCFVQLSYSWRPPIPPLPGIALSKTIVWRNFPPAHVWTYRRQTGTPQR